MNGVGFCAVSRCVNVAQTLADIYDFKQEKLGSRPPNQLLVGKGVPGRLIMDAFRMADSMQDNFGVSRHSRTIAIGSDENTEISIDKIDLTSMDQFDENTSVNVGMALIATAFGLDVSEIWPSTREDTGSSGSRLASSRVRGKLPKLVTRQLASILNRKLVPANLRCEFDFQDDVEDNQRALTRDIRGRNRERDINNGAINVRSARIIMLRDGDINHDQFAELEMTDGRLPDGLSIESLLYHPHEQYRRHLKFSLNMLDYANNDPAQARQLIAERKSKVYGIMLSTASSSRRDRLRNVVYALDYLDERYMKLMDGSEVEDEPGARVTQPAKPRAARSR